MEIENPPEKISENNLTAIKQIQDVYEQYEEYGILLKNKMVKKELSSFSVADKDMKPFELSGDEYFYFYEPKDKPSNEIVDDFTITQKEIHEIIESFAKCRQ